MQSFRLHQTLFVLLCITGLSCRERNTAPTPTDISALNLKKGVLISCNPAGQELGTLVFNISGNPSVQANFTLGLKLLHSFEYDEAEKVFAGIIDQQPDCPMAYWGVAMSNFHPLWTPPSAIELSKGAKAIAIAQTTAREPKEKAYIDATAAYYKDWDKTDHRARSLNFEKAMQQLHTTYPDDHEATILYALALTAAADPADKTFKKQQQAGTLLQALYPGQPNHPGIVHYLIHAYDAPELANLGLPAARKYATLAPSSAHALHMPSHIFTRLGLWDECIKSNLASVASAQCYAQQTGREHWDEELHGIDYLVYAYLQRGDNKSAQQQVTYLSGMKKVEPVNFKVAYAFAAVPARFALENKQWAEAARLQVAAPLNWNQYPWQNAIIRFTRLMGSAHIGDKAGTQIELQALKQIYDTLVVQKDDYKASQVQVQIITGEAWMLLQEGKKEEAWKRMQQAAGLEDKTEKHPVTPGEVIPARELLGDLLLQINKPAQALEAYEADLARHANRFNGLYGASLAAAQAGNKEKASKYYQQLLAIAVPDADRKEIGLARKWATVHK